jgi:NACHT domain
MEKLQYHPQITAQPDRGLVCQRHHALRMERIWSELAPLDPWQTLVLSSAYSFPETDGFTPFVAGAGKSVIWYVDHSMFSCRELTVSTSSTIIEDIEDICKTGRASLAMYYYDFREDQKRDLRGLLSSILYQLCDQSDSYYNILSNFHSIHRDGEQSPSDDVLIRCSKSLFNLQGLPPVYLIIDGLDECPGDSVLSSPRREVLSLLEDLVEARLPNLRICVTSRPETDIKPILEPLTFRSISLHDESGQKEDIENYIRSMVTTNWKMRRWTAEHKQLVIDELTERADGM